MATFYKRGNRWRVEFFYKGKRYSKTFATKVECKNWFIYRLHELEHSIIKYSDKTVSDALTRYCLEESPKKKGYSREKLFIEKLKRHPIAKLSLEQATTIEWAKWRDARLLEVKASSVRRELTVVKAMYHVAINEWLWLEDSPMTNLRLPASSAPRDRRIFPDEEQKILEALDYNLDSYPVLLKHYVALAFLFALETAMRSSEIVGLTWENVFIAQSYVHIPDSKNGTKRNVPLSNKAINILNRLPRKHKYCFNLSSKQRDSIFRKYRDKANVVDLTFHDTRHEAITRLAKKLDIFDLSRMVGIKDLKTLMVYYNATASEIAKLLN